MLEEQMPQKFLDQSENTTKFTLSPEERELLEEAFLEYGDKDFLETYTEVDNIETLETVQQDFLWRALEIVDDAKLGNPIKYNDLYAKLADMIRSLPAPLDVVVDEEEDDPYAFLYDPEDLFSPIRSPEETEEYKREQRRLDEEYDPNFRNWEEFSDLSEEQKDRMEEVFTMFERGDIDLEVMGHVVEQIVDGKDIVWNETVKRGIKTVQDMLNNNQADLSSAEFMLDMVLGLGTERYDSLHAESSDDTEYDILDRVFDMEDSGMLDPELSKWFVNLLDD